MKKIFKRILWSLLALFVIANIIVWITDTTYIYKALIYQHADIDDMDIFESRTIRSSSNKSDWSIAADNNKIPLSDTLRKMLVNNQSVAFLVIQNDSIRHEEYWDGYSDSSLSNSFSMAKSVVSMLIGIAIEEGKIKSVDQPVSDFLPEFKEGEKSKITIRHLLTMSSGLDFMESYSTPFNYTTEAYYGSNLQRMIRKLKVIEEPGTIDRYKSGDPQILELILSKATGKAMSEYFSEKVWQKIGTMHDAKWNLDHKDGDEKAYCCIYSNARDFARLGKLYMDSGRYNHVQIVPEEWVKNSISPNKLTGEHGEVTENYGWQWWIMNRHGYHIFYMRGLAGQYIVCIPERKMIIVRLGHKRSEQKIDGHPVDVITFVDESLKLFP